MIWCPSSLLQTHWQECLKNLEEGAAAGGLNNWSPASRNDSVVLQVLPLQTPPEEGEEDTGWERNNPTPDVA